MIGGEEKGCMEMKVHSVFISCFIEKDRVCMSCLFRTGNCSVIRGAGYVISL
jgi:hypothetical protein